jgi:nucleoside-diphosphate-sugar epimerase
MPRDAEGCGRALVDEVRASHLLHLAWHAVPGGVWNASENEAWAATIGLAEDFAAAGGSRAVFAGTCAEYAWGAPGPLREDAPLRPASRYGACKDAARRGVEGLDVATAWGRVFHVYGPGDDPRRLVGGVARAILAGERAATTAGDQVRDFLHVDDVAGAFAALAAGDVRGAVNVASGAGVTVRRIAELTAAAAGGPGLLDVGAIEPRPGDPARLVADVARLREEVGYSPAIGLEDGIAATVAWLRGRESVSATARRGPSAS